MCDDVVQLPGDARPLSPGGMLKERVGDRAGRRVPVASRATCPSAGTYGGRPGGQANRSTPENLPPGGPGPNGVMAYTTNGITSGTHTRRRRWRPSR